MNKKYSILFLIPLLGFLLLQKEHQKPFKKAASLSRTIKHDTLPQEDKIQGEEKTYPSSKLGHTKKNEQSKKEIETIFRAQSGNSLKEVAVNKIDNFQWTHGGNTIEVESFIVTLKNHLNTTTTFKVLVDAQTGKIIESWDQPIFDPVNPRNNFKVRLDPRYHND